jgi:phosphatidylserine decarboxylase
MSAVSYATAQVLRVLPRASISRAIGRVAELPWPRTLERTVVGLYSRAYDVRLDECADRSWPSFDAFFTRRLREGVRRVDDDPRTVTSPADGRVTSIARIDASGRLIVKGRPYSVAELVGDPQEAERFLDGAGFVVYLSPRDYHRVHAPVSGTIRRIRSMPGDFYPVNDIGMRHVPRLLSRNRRVAIEIDSTDDCPGRVTVVMVVAMVVGRITTLGSDARDVPLGDHVFDPPLRVRRGEEIGVFHLGSTIVALVEHAAVGEKRVGEGPVRYGQPLLRAPLSRHRIANGVDSLRDGTPAASPRRGPHHEEGGGG